MELATPVDSIVLLMCFASVAVSFIAFGLETRVKRLMLPLWTALECAVSLRLTLLTGDSPLGLPLEQSLPAHLEACATYLFFAGLLANSSCQALVCFSFFTAAQLIKIALTLDGDFFAVQVSLSVVTFVAIASAFCLLAAKLRAKASYVEGVVRAHDQAKLES